MPRNIINTALLVIFGLASAAVFAAALFVPAFRNAPYGLGYAPLRELVLPPPAPIVLTVVYSTEKEDWIEDITDDFYRTNPLVNGRPVEIEFSATGSREMYLDVLNGVTQPDVISPASSLQTAILENLSTVQNGTPYVRANDPASCRQVVESPLVLVAWRERADVLWGAGPPADLWPQLHDALVNPQGWGAYGRPEWGFLKFGHTDPLRSNSGFMTLVLMTYGYYERTSNLTSADILNNPDYQAWLLGIEDTVPEFGSSTGTYMNDIVAFGPSTYDIVAVYEATAIGAAENAVGRYGELRVYYPPATVMSDHPFCILDASWVTDEKRQAANLFIDFLLSNDAQQAAYIQHGFRPVNPAVPLNQTGSPFDRYAANGLQATLPPEVEIPPGDVLNTLLDFWARNINP